MNKILWSDLSRVDRYRCLSWFVRFEHIKLLSINEYALALLLQLIFIQYGLKTNNVYIREKYFDLELFNKRYKWSEYARIFLPNKRLSLNFLYA